MTVGKFASRQTVKSRDIWQGLTIEPAPPSDPKREAQETAARVERERRVVRMVGARFGADREALVDVLGALGLEMAS